MDLVDSGAVTDRKKRLFRGKSLADYAVGSPLLMKWLDRNPRGVKKFALPPFTARCLHRSELLMLWNE